VLVRRTDVPLGPIVVTPNERRFQQRLTGNRLKSRSRIHSAQTRRQLSPARRPAHVPKLLVVAGFDGADFSRRQVFRQGPIWVLAVLSAEGLVFRQTINHVFNVLDSDGDHLLVRFRGLTT
jgi:hypothetical protein